MRQRTSFKVFHAGTFKSAEATYELAADFMSSLETHQIISVNLRDDGKVIVWYRER
jgi:hypothetical protein